MSRIHTGMLAATLSLLVVSACEDDPGVQGGGVIASSAPESRQASDGVAPRTDTIVAREGDHLLVIVDIAPKDALGRRVERASIEIDGPESRVSAAAPPRTGDRLTIEVRVPAATRQLKLIGTSEGGASWSSVLSTVLDG